MSDETPPRTAPGRRPRRRRAAQGRLRQAQGRAGQGHRRPARGPRGAADRDLRPRALPPDRRARAGQDADDPHPGRRPEPDLQPDPVHPRPDALGHHRDRGDPGGQGDRRPPVQVPPRARSSPTSCWPTRSTGPRPRPRRPCSRRCRSGRSPSAASGTACPTRSSCWPPRTRSSRKGPIRSPRPSSTGSCSTSWSTTPTRRRSSTSSG